MPEKLTPEEKEIEKLRRKKARKDAAAALRREEGRQVARQYIETGKAIGRAPKAAKEYISKKVTEAQTPREETGEEKISKKRVAARVVGGVTTDVLKGGGKAVGRAAKTVALEGPGYVKEKMPEIQKAEAAVGGEAVSLFRTVFRMTRGQGLGKIRTPVHPDKTVKNKSLYFGWEGVPNNMMPLGRPMTDWRELHFGRGPVQRDASEVLNALMSGAPDIESIKIHTGLNETRIKGALRFLQQQGKDVKFLEE